jgi:hypothetical protein
MTAEIIENDTRLAELAARIDCFTEDQFAYLAAVKPSTLLAWRKRGEGPPWVRVGNEIFYPRRPLQQHIERLARDTTPPSRQVCL